MSADYIFEGAVIEWRGPAPYFYVPMPVEDAEDLKEDARGLEYWGQVAVTATIGETTFTTALFPKDGTYLLPLKVVVRRAEGIDLDDVLEVRMRLGHD
ncbi:DUF1905 domain-containing protein [Nocardioides albertanoniae]|uniref:DUF1905 domain-containing protein n=1 Tax=Nocardioides albertanoniae TaxID=1175486 RepID=UPI001FE8AA1C|nr:DUF1905 domain-containing protein [Nocardioides albertanoniae]